MKMDPNCIFCKIIARESPASIIFQDDLVLAFHDIHPSAPIHILIVPIEHIPRFVKLTFDHSALLSRMFLVAKQLAVKNHIEKTGFRLIINSGPDANQTVFHLHLHLLGGRPMRYPMG
jgi:histidine triad (HIT) family protein